MSKPVSLGRWTLELGSGWEGIETHESPPMFLLSAARPEVALSVTLVEGHGTEEECREFLARGSETFQGEREEAIEAELAGVRLPGIRIHAPRAAEGSSSLIEMHAAAVGDDLFAFTISFPPEAEDADAVRRRVTDALGPAVKTRLAQEAQARRG